MRTILALSVIAVAAASQAFMIDDFSDGDVTMARSTTGLDFAWNNASVLGGVRTTYNFVADSWYGLDSTVKVTNGIFSVSSEAGVDGSGGLAYGYDLNGTAVDLNLDLSSYSQFTVDINYNDIAADVQIQVGSTANGTSAVTHHVGPVAFGSTQTLVFDFSEFTIPMDDIDYILIAFDGDVSNDIVADNFQAVPEPATLVFGFASLAALAAKRRLKKSK